MGGGNATGRGGLRVRAGAAGGGSLGGGGDAVPNSGGGAAPVGGGDRSAGGGSGNMRSGRGGGGGAASSTTPKTSCRLETDAGSPMPLVTSNDATVSPYSSVCSTDTVTASVPGGTTDAARTESEAEKHTVLAVVWQRH